MVHKITFENQNTWLKQHSEVIKDKCLNLTLNARTQQTA